MLHDYGIYARHELDLTDGWRMLPRWDYFLSAYNLSSRIRTVYDHVSAKNRLWLIHQEYGLSTSELPTETRFESTAADESTYCKELLERLVAQHGFNPRKHSLCIDITGVLRPHLMFLARLLKSYEVRSFTALYAEPTKYASREKTAFSSGEISAVRPVHGFEGSPSGSAASPFLIVGVGYDDRLLAAVAEHREKAVKHQLFGLPSLRADMYQESVLRSRKAAEEIGDPNFAPENRSFAPANDPFGTASVLSDLVAQRLHRYPESDIILAPLGPKPQVLGFALFHMQECLDRHASIIFPFSTGYAAETSTGVARVWMYNVEL